MCIYTQYHYLICLQLVVTSVGLGLLQHHSHLLVLYISSLRLWGPCGLFAVSGWSPLVCISSWFKQQFCWDGIVIMEIGLLICSQYMDSLGAVYFIQQMSWDIRVWKPGCRLDNGGIVILFPAGQEIFLCYRTFRLALGSTEPPVP